MHSSTFRLNNKSLITNLIATAILLASFADTPIQPYLFAVGAFALSGALTNWLAVHMLFEKVPGLYGSGVIPNRFAEFKLAIKQLMMAQFFSPTNIERFIASEEQTVHQWLKPQRLIEAVDYDQLFERLVDAIMASSFGSMLSMFGGRNALTGLKQPFIDNIKRTLADMVDGERFQTAVQESIDVHRLGDDMRTKIEAMVDQRLEELTPQLVKEIVQNMIAIHLGWLVVWGGVFGGLIGLLVALVQ
ncbi:MAG: DUF445 domain-containing protein [Gammaproteobacteria bacterium]|nr:DUF445 domain-containing protein [Gammaproteobacteria bacterium]